MKSGWLTVINWIILLQVFTFAVNASPAPRIVAKAVSLLKLDTKYRLTDHQYLGMPNFPSASAWQSLNETVKGRLIKFAHPGASCYVSTFNELECERFRDQLSNATAVGENPFLTNWPQWAGNPCQPTADNYTVDPQAPKCKQGKFPDYALAARSAEDVSIGLKFAAKWNIRVIVKNTGHDFLGRNVGTGALSIWTRNIQGFEWIDEWKQGIKTSVSKRRLQSHVGVNLAVRQKSIPRFGMALA